MPIVVTEGDTISTFQEIKQTFPFLRKMPYLYFPSEFIKHISSQGLCLKNVQKWERDLWRIFLQHRVIVDIYKRGWLLSQLIPGYKLKQCPERDLAESHWQPTVLLPRGTGVRSGGWEFYPSINYMCHSMAYTMRMCPSANHCHSLLSCQFFNQGWHKYVSADVSFKFNLSLVSPHLRFIPLTVWIHIISFVDIYIVFPVLPFYYGRM